ncbi:hypothetical protein Vadar_016558 [Vaccinium darrowii]|uniref:Uncharacterized protein n=1 Tax=Vaccinium darrowii TaxID=229202 RepID=A0ACB7Y6Y1_9ERIC|nr:hypothetical protein Vadar_016558 [Vaccinium darrowii]
MAVKFLSPLPFHALLILFTLFTASQAGDIVVYWGQNGGEGKLIDDARAKASRFCCRSEVEPGATLCRAAVLDGIDFDIEQGEPHYAALARRLVERSKGGKKVYLAAAPQCPFPDQKLNGALSTGLFDFVWIQFYNNPQCEYDTNNPNSFKGSWTKWVQSIPAQKFFVGLPASKAAASNGYIPKEVLINQVLPFVKGSSKYGGIMLWDRFNDLNSKYSDAVRGSV